MSNPGDSAAQDDFPEGKVEKPTSAQTSSVADYEKDVVTACNDMEFGEDKKWKVPEGMSNEMQFAVNSERRRRDTQAAHTKSQQELKASEARSNALLERLESKIAPSLTVDEAEELEDLKESNPEAWREKLNEHEATAKTKHQEEMDTIDADAGTVAEVERRESLLAEFNSSNPDLELNDSVFENDLPQRITGKLQSGESTFEEFLVEAKKYLEKGKAIVGATDKHEEEPNLSKSGGNSKPADSAVAVDAIKDYKKEIF